MRYHLSTLVVMVLVAGLILWLNLSPWPNCWAHLSVRNDAPAWCFGWPGPFAKQHDPDLIAAFTRDLRLFPFIVNLGFAMFMTLGFGWINERWLSFRDALAQVRAGSPASPHR
jgi:hypothetical protein